MGKRKRPSGDDQRHGGGDRKKKKEYSRMQYGIDIDPADCTNAMFERYYFDQGIVPQTTVAGADEKTCQEWQAFLCSMRTSLPMSVRISRFREGWSHLVKSFKQTEICSPIKWYPEALAWKCDNDEYHADTEEARAFKAHIKRENNIGSLTFQEEVSLLPPLLLKLNPDCKLLDMCAAPGSKTLEALELMHADDHWDTIDGVPKLANGLVIANDNDARRVNNILVPRTRKLHTPCIVTTIGNSAKFPVLSSDDTSSNHFDRILLDAPCSGDGTMRKEPQIWKSWAVKNGLELHNIQFKLLCRAVTLLKVGGLVVYSTCSLNPLENEAVVGAVLKKFHGVVTLDADVTQTPSGLKYATGLTTWRVPDPRKEGIEWIPSPDSIPSELQPQHTTLSVRPTMFPPRDPIDAVELKKCIRLLPHQNNAGGFFCAVLRKTKTLARDEEKVDASIPNQSKKDAIDKSKNTTVGGTLFYDDQAYHEMVTGSSEYEDLMKFYGLVEGLYLFGFTDKGGDDRKVSIVSKGVRDWLVALSASKSKLKFKQLQFASFGVRAFKKFSGDYLPSAGSRWRPCQEGAAFMSRVAKRRCLRIPKDVMLQLATSKKLCMKDLNELKEANKLDGWNSILKDGDVELGGVLVGIYCPKARSDSPVYTSSRIWISAAFTHNGIDTFASKGEIEGIINQLQEMGK